MQQGFSLSYYWSKSFLLNSKLLWLLLVCNFLGTIYGYVWYWDQMVFTIANYPVWYIPFVPDSPTASLFFTGSVAYLLMDRKSNKPKSAFRGFVEAFALITSFKYGIWAVAMIWTGAWQGVPVGWDGWMLTASHLAMAVEALLFARWYTHKLSSIIIVAIWTLWNDFMDYERGIFPGLPERLHDDLPTIEAFTIGLSITGIIIALVFSFTRNKNKNSTT
ncbi:DUF1405 domain-containing protein [Paenibacillus sedimenti]|uniref:DUF1405 domain-containing protein n=1 Tax=Paenibacillus sedimenti TaxID=2770274 RepID=A0A926QJC4_9BACL|nr:DUF1405 domain-containing protein [Paenibacillus sedimenti]MBD0380563.1 DUF1405 domain-containing protein [Paenibacillus sedimenti]